MRYLMPTTLLSILWLAGTAGWTQLLPVGDDFQVSTGETYPEVDPSRGAPEVALGPGGEFLVVWAANPYFHEGRSFSPDGTPGAEFTVVTFGYKLQATKIALSADPAGQVVAVWSGVAADGSSIPPGINGRRYAVDGTAVGERFVASPTRFPAFSPSVAKGASGGFVVVWHAFSADYVLPPDVYGRRYDASGTAAGDVFRVNADTAGSQTDSSVAVGPDGGFLVVWSTAGPTDADDSGSSIRGRLYDAAGRPATGEIAVNTSTLGHQRSPVVAAAPDGRFLVVWQSETSSGSDASLDSIQGRLLAADAAPLGDELQINTFAAGHQRRPAVAAAPRGGFVVVWDSDGSGGSDTADSSIQARVLAPDGSPLEEDFQVNTETLGFQSSPSVAVGRGGEVVIVWDDAQGEPEDLETGIRGRRLVLPELPPAPPPACADPRILCLGDGGRFQVEVEWGDFAGNFGPAHRVGGSARTPESGLFYFFDADNWEVLIKVLDGCGFNDHFWVFAAATTNVAYTITVTDTAAGRDRVYANPLGTAAAAITDIEAFATCGVRRR